MEIILISIQNSLIFIYLFVEVVIDPILKLSKSLIFLLDHNMSQNFAIKTQTKFHEMLRDWATKTTIPQLKLPYT